MLKNVVVDSVKPFTPPLTTSLVFLSYVFWNNMGIYDKRNEHLIIKKNITDVIVYQYNKCNVYGNLDKVQV